MGFNNLTELNTDEQVILYYAALNGRRPDAELAIMWGGGNVSLCIEVPSGHLLNLICFFLFLASL